jgi:MoeA N-terminal region (domain I and II)
MTKLDAGRPAPIPALCRWRKLARASWRICRATSSTARLRKIGTSKAGARFEGVLTAGTCVRIFTGAMVPDGADTIAPQEDASKDGSDVEIREVPLPGRHIRPAGLDFSARPGRRSHSPATAGSARGAGNAGRRDRVRSSRRCVLTKPERRTGRIAGVDRVNETSATPSRASIPDVGERVRSPIRRDPSFVMPLDGRVPLAVSWWRTRSAGRNHGGCTSFHPA